jgi:hypothetical protein
LPAHNADFVLLALQRSPRDPQRATVLDVRRENGQAAEVFRIAVAALALTVAVGGCAKKGAPEQVADAFADAYFRRADQEKAKEFTALGATEMLDTELRAVEKIRREGYTPSEAADSEVTVRRGEPTARDQRLRFPFEVSIKLQDGSQTIRDADIELTQIQGVWKVVRVGLKQRAP